MVITEFSCYNIIVFSVSLFNFSWKTNSKRKYFITQTLDFEIKMNHFCQLIWNSQINIKRKKKPIIADRLKCLNVHFRIFESNAKMCSYSVRHWTHNRWNRLLWSFERIHSMVIKQHIDVRSVRCWLANGTFYRKCADLWTLSCVLLCAILTLFIELIRRKRVRASILQWKQQKINSLPNKNNH